MVRPAAVPLRPVLQQLHVRHPRVHCRARRRRLQTDALQGAVHGGARALRLRARCVCALIFVAIAASIAPYHVLFIGILVKFNVCTILWEHEAAFSVFYVVEMFIFRLVPVAIIAVINAFIIYRVTSLARAKRQWMTGQGSVDD